MESIKDKKIKKIVIVEDDTVLGDILTKKLIDQGYDAVLAREGGMGLQMIKDVKPDLVLLDIILPVMNGYEILEAKLKDPLISAIPVIVISNSGQPVEINRVLSLGVKDYLVKAQFDPSEVLEKVREIFAVEAMKVSGGSASKKKIMWVEDDTFLNDLIAQKLSMQNYSLFHAENGEEALKTAEKEQPDIIMLDLLLTGLNGYEILQQLKQNVKTKDIPVMILSNLSQKSEIDKCTSLGAVGYLVKASVTLDEIVAEINKIVGV